MTCLAPPVAPRRRGVFSLASAIVGQQQQQQQPIATTAGRAPLFQFFCAESSLTKMNTSS